MPEEDNRAGKALPPTESANKAKVELSPTLSAATGATGAAVALAIAYPLVVAKARIQAQRTGGANGSLLYKGPFHCLAKTVREEGLPGLYVGLVGALMREMLVNWTYFFIFSFLGRFGPKPGSTTSRTKLIWIQFVKAALASIVNQTALMPYDMVLTRVQTERRSSSSSKQASGFTGVIRDIYRTQGLVGFWDGLVPGYLLSTAPGLVMAFQAALDGGKKESAATNFLVGFISKFGSTIVTYPLVVVKTQIYVAGRDACGDEASGGVKAFLVCLQRTFSEEGLGGFYKGLYAHMVQNVLKEAIGQMVRLEMDDRIGKIIAQRRRQV